MVPTGWNSMAGGWGTQFWGLILCNVSHSRPNPSRSGFLYREPGMLSYGLSDARSISFATPDMILRPISDICHSGGTFLD